MTSLRRSTRARTTRQSYVEVPASDGDTMMEEPVVEEGSRCRPVVVDTDDEWVEDTPAGPAELACGDEKSEAPASERVSKRRRLVVDDTDDEWEVYTPTVPAELADEAKQAPASASKRAVPTATKQTTLVGFARAAVPQGETPRGNNGPSRGKQAVASATPRQTTLEGFARALPPQGEMPRGDSGHVEVKQAVASASKPAAPKRAAPASTRQTTLQGFTSVQIPRGEMPRGDSDVGADIPGPRASEVGFDEDSDEEDDFIPGPDPNVADEVGDEPEIFDLYTELEDADIEVDEDFARKLRIILDLLCGWFKNVSYRDFRAMPEADRPVTFGTYRVLSGVSVEMLVGLYIPAIPLPVQELFSKREWCLEDLLSLPKIGAKDAAHQGLYANFPTGNLQHTQKMGCECYVGSTNALQKRVDDHLKVSRKHTVPKRHGRSFHYGTTCRVDVACNFRKLAAFKRSIPIGYLTILESIFMILFGSYNHPGYTSRWATESSYKMTEEIRAKLDLVQVVWKGLNAALPLRQGTITRNSKTASPCCNPACKAMTYPYFMNPDGLKHSRVLVNSADPLGGYLCRRCESYQERHGELPDAATLEKLTSQYTLEVAKSDLRAAGQDVVCDICGAVEGADGAANSAMGSGSRHIATNGQIRCMACEAYLRKFGKERDPLLQFKKAIRDQANADREAGRPVRCKFCNAIEPAGAGRGKRWVVSKDGGLICRYCYDKKGRR